MALTHILKKSSCLVPGGLLRNHKKIHKLFTARIYSLVMLKPNTVYFQNNKGDEKLLVAFQLVNDELSINKQMKFERKMSETVEVFLNRFDMKLAKVIENRARKKSKKNNLEQPVNVPEVKSDLLLNNESMPKNLVFENIFNYKNNGNLKLRILNNDYDILFNYPLINELQLPEKIREGCVIYPSKFETECTNHLESIFKWYKSQSAKKNWIQCGEKFFYIPTKEDVGCLLKLECTPVNNDLIGPTGTYQTSNPVQEFNGLVEIKKRHEFTKSKTGNDEFRIVSYNILADCYTDTKESKSLLFTYCEPDILKLSYRKDLINVEILGYNADLICLQEVDRQMFISNFLPVFQNLSFDGIFTERENNKEGCAILYDTKKFNLLFSKAYNYSYNIMKNPLLESFRKNIEKNKALIERLSVVSSRLQVGVFECLTHPNNLILLGNTHLYFHPNADHIRLLQGLVAFNILLDNFQKLQEQHPNKNISLMLCGDFNSTPECGFHTYLTEGSIGSDHIDWKSKKDEEIENISHSHNFKMKNACGTSTFTNYTRLFKACLDYIYYQADHLEIKQTVPFPPEESLSLQTAIPSEFYPSDHVALIADFKFKSS